MSQVPGRIRVALAAFEHTRDLSPALVGLDRLGFHTTQLGLAARASMFSRLKQHCISGAFNAGSAARLICGSSALGLSVAHEPVLISAGPLWPMLACFGSGPEAPLVTAPWMPAQFREDLGRHLAKGSIVLGVGSGSTGQHMAATQLLLSHSSHRVHTHDFNH